MDKGMDRRGFLKSSALTGMSVGLAASGLGRVARASANGKVVLAVAGSKFAGYEGFGSWERGHVLLQDHGDEVHFRSIKIRETK